MKPFEDRTYDYPAWRRDVYAWGLLVFLVICGIKVVWAPPRGGWNIDSSVGGGLFAGLVVWAGVTMHKARRRDFRSVRIFDGGIEQEARSGSPVSLGWDEIDHVEPLDARAGYGDVSGMRIVAGDREIRILRPIRGWKELRARVEREARVRNLPIDAPE